MTPTTSFASPTKFVASKHAIPTFANATLNWSEGESKDILAIAVLHEDGASHDPLSEDGGGERSKRVRMSRVCVMSIMDRRDVSIRVVAKDGYGWDLGSVIIV